MLLIFLLFDKSAYLYDIAKPHSEYHETLLQNCIRTHPRSLSFFRISTQIARCRGPIRHRKPGLFLHNGLRHFCCSLCTFGFWRDGFDYLFSQKVALYSGRKVPLRPDFWKRLASETASLRSSNLSYHLFSLSIPFLMKSFRLTTKPGAAQPRYSFHLQSMVGSGWFRQS